jgi:hypothetical protein
MAEKSENMVFEIELGPEARPKKRRISLSCWWWDEFRAYYPDAEDFPAFSRHAMFRWFRTKEC